MFNRLARKAPPHEQPHDQPSLPRDLGMLQAQQHAPEPDATPRRHALRWLMGGVGAIGSLSLWGCGGGGSSAAGTALLGSGTGTTTTTSATTSTVNGCAVIPTETAGPYPGDGTNTASGSVANALTLNGIVRSDIRSSIGGATGTAAGVPLTITLKLVNAAGSCANLAGYAIYLWHCNAAGQYSMYSSGVTAQNYLRGVQVTDDNGEVTFTTIFPACYAGRWPHVHFEVYPSLAVTTSGSNDVKTSQLALPEAPCREVYATAAYSASVSNLNAISLTSDNVFSDGTALQLATCTGSVSAGYAATLTVGISA
jgi:protocatechuate 3,4-dioxygenase beta subunit